MMTDTQTLIQLFEQLDEIQAGKGLWQNRFHEFDVYSHTMACVMFTLELLADTVDDDMVVVAVLHDIGKPASATLKHENGKLEEKEPGVPYYSFTDHEKVGAKMVLGMDPALFNAHGLDQQRISKLVEHHFAPMLGIKQMRKTTNFADFVKVFEQLIQTLLKTGLSLEDVMNIFYADCMAKGKFCTDRDELFLVRAAILDETRDLKAIYLLQQQMYGGKQDL